MNLNDREPPTVDPTPRTPQQLAAAKRAWQTEPNDERRTTNDERRIPQFVFGAALVILVIAGLVILVSQHGAPLTPRPLITPEPTFVTSSVAAQEPFSAPTAPPATKETAPATIPAYAAPRGVVLGPIEVTRRMSAVAHYGSAWVQADVDGSGLVWLRAADVPQLGLIGADLSMAPQTGRGLTLNAPPTPAVWQPEPTDPPTAPPEPTAAPIVASDPLRIRAEDDCNAEHGRCDPPCTAEHGRCAVGDK